MCIQEPHEDLIIWRIRNGRKGVRSEERRVGKSVRYRLDPVCRRFIYKNKQFKTLYYYANSPILRL